MSSGIVVPCFLQTWNHVQTRWQDKTSGAKWVFKGRSRAVMCEVTPLTTNESTRGLPVHPSLKYGFPISAHLIVKDRFVVQLDPRTRNPLYVLEYVSPASLTNIAVKRGSSHDESEESDELGGLTSVSGHFVEEGAVPKHMRSRMDDYTKSGYDRGHLAPAGNHRDTVKAFRDTFTLANVSPQVGEFNRGYWARLERFARNVAKDYDSTIIATGPLYVPGIVHADQTYQSSGGVADDLFATGQPCHWMQHDCIGTSMSRPVYVPTHFFKIILCEVYKEGKTEIYMACFVLPNMDIDDRIPAEQFLVSLHEVEELAGVDLFPNLLDDRSRENLKKHETDKMHLPKVLRRSLQDHNATTGSSCPSGNRAETLLYEHIAGSGISPEQHQNNISHFKGEKEQKAIQRSCMPIYHLCQFRRCVLPPRRLFPDRNKP